MEKCAQSVLSVILVFALEIWTLRYEPHVSGSSCSLVGVWRNAWSDYGYVFCVSRFHGAVLGLVVDMSVGVYDRLWSDRGENCGLRSCIPRSWSLSLVCGSCRFSGASVEETVVSHRCSLSARVPGQRFLACLLSMTGYCTVKVPQIQFIACFGGHSSCAIWTGMMLPAVFLMVVMMMGF